MVVPIYKKLEAGLARIQILQRDSVIQLVAVLEGLALGRCMSFALRGTDVFEIASSSSSSSSSRGSGKHAIRFVDAKFALPRRATAGGPGAGKDSSRGEGDGEGRDGTVGLAEAEFVCLDAPEYPAEHDDIFVGFDTEEGEWRAQEALLEGRRTPLLGLGY